MATDNAKHEAWPPSGGTAPPHSDYHPYPYQAPPDDEIDLRQLLRVVWMGRWWVIGATALFAVLGVIYALSLPNIFQSSAKLAPAEEVRSPALGGGLGGLASLAGVSVGEGGDKVTLAVEIAKSRKFVREFVSRHHLMPGLMAVKAWDSNANTLIYDPEIYDHENKRWVRDVEPPKTPEPSFDEVYEVFLNSLNIGVDKKTGFVTVAFKHQSPFFARNVVDGIVRSVNDDVRLKDIQRAQGSIAYLEKELEKTSESELKASLFSLIEEQMKIMMLASIRDGYVFQEIDPAYVPEKRFSPARSVICILFTLLGSILSVFFVIVKAAFRSR